MVIRLIALLLMLLAGPLQAQSPSLSPGGTRLMILHDHANPVVAEMVKLRLRGEYDLTVSLEDLRFPDSEDYDWIQIDRDRWFKERIGGRMIQIFERDIALFPRRSGELSVGPITHDLTHIIGNGTRQPVRVTSAPTRLTVKPFPHRARPMTARNLVLTDELSAAPGRLAQDEILTRRVTIEALGALAHHLPPRPDIQQPWLISFTLPELRETVPTAQGPVSRVVWEWQLRPRTGEPGVLPAVPFAWFDTDTRRIEVAAMKPIPFGFAGFTTFSGASSGDGLRSGVVMASLAMLGFAAALVTVLGRRLPALGRRLRALSASPHLGAMRSAAAARDLVGLRGAAARHLDWRGTPSARQQHHLDRLDEQIYATPDAADGFDADLWLKTYLR